MTAVVFYFQVHQPFRLRRQEGASFASIHDYFDDTENERTLRRVAERCYVPMNTLLRQLIDETEGAFRCAFSLSGTALDQLERWAPEALQTFVELAETECVEFLGETSHHSLAAVGDRQEFGDQVVQQRRRVAALFGRHPTTFRNTELIVDNAIARQLEDLGFDMIIGEGAERLLGARTHRRLYRPKTCRDLVLLLRDYWLSDDIAFRFSNREWSHYPLRAETFASWLHGISERDAIVGLFMDYETFGEHQGETTGIFEFMRHLPRFVLEDAATRFATPSEVLVPGTRIPELDIPDSVSWADAERDLSAWLGNPMQQEAHDALYGLLPRLRTDPVLLETWRKLSTSDHFYYMCTKPLTDGDVHEYFCPYLSPQDAFTVFMHVLDDLATVANGSPHRRGPGAARAT